MIQKYIISTIAYFVLTMAIAYPWHLIWFHDLYLELGAFTRAEPIIAFGMLSITIQGFIMAYLYSRYYRGGHPVVEGIKFGLIFGLVIYTVMAFTTVAKFDINPIATFLLYHTIFQLIQFIVTGAAMGLIFGRDFNTANT